MTTEEYISKLNGQVSHLKDGIIVAIAAQDTHSKMLERIFEQGKKQDGSDIGEYDTKKPLYINPVFAPKSFAPKGKNGSTKFENGTNHKTAYFESYAEYRKKIGRKTDKVNLVLSGLLQSDFGRGVIKISDFVYTSRVSTERSKKIIEGMNEKYGEVFGLTESEKVNFKEILKYETIQILNA